MTGSWDGPLDAADRRLSIGETAAILCGRLGRPVTAYLVGARDEQQLAAHADGSTVDDLYARRLRAGFEIVRMIEAAYDDATAKAWLFGTNARLGDQAPIDAIAHATDTRQLVDAIRAAHAFVQREP